MKLTSLNRLTVRALSATFVVSAALLATSNGAYAQTSTTPATHQLTRADVRHELEELEAAGYDPSRGDDSNYPADIQEAERKVAAMHAAQTSALNDNQPAMQTMPTH
ncbi:DUF4148 domain-containing protein [Paraburkholderia sp. FT54]|uniref:DUF4148 domain-containing protein n=1 Tax=Paraburkholderia sp. FT54 TaxID=3074437 RepID=UPI002877D5E5|nr:DUF4148 domain-containing protein [Paraburkholderia sp. FT54]WNC93728.1 DUF4148 domain-containing protein [Paraburkholderia sp. FT54]